MCPVFLSPSMLSRMVFVFFYFFVFVFPTVSFLKLNRFSFSFLILVSFFFPLRLPFFFGTQEVSFLADIFQTIVLLLFFFW